MHELAHVLRWDAAVNHLQNVVQAVFFFSPADLVDESENPPEAGSVVMKSCCRHLVLSRVYCEAIVEMLAQEYTSRESTPVLAVTGSIKNVKEKIHNHADTESKIPAGGHFVAVLSVLFITGRVLSADGSLSSTRKPAP